MLLFLHIMIALASILQTSLLPFSPSRAKLQVSYGLLALTVTSGTALVATTNTPILQSCITGLLYVGFVSAGIAIARRRMRAAPLD